MDNENQREFTRALIEQQKAAQQPPGGPLAC